VDLLFGEFVVRESITDFVLLPEKKKSSQTLWPGREERKGGSQGARPLFESEAEADTIAISFSDP
jgi:hypothetical protein